MDWRGVLIVCISLGLGGHYVINLARQGEPVGWVIIVSLIVAFLLLIIIGLVLIMMRSQHVSFNANARENLAMQAQSQSLTNAQITGLARILRVEREAQKSLPPLAPEPPPGLIFDGDVFAGLGDGWE
jgi:hypothetical protein